MRSVVAVVSAVAMVLAQIPPGFAQNAGSAQPAAAAYNPALDATVTVNPAIVGAFKAFPKGGDPLTKRIADIIVKDPSLAPGLVKHVMTDPGLSKDQKLAAERGLAEALTRLGVKAADMPVYKAPPPQAAVYDYTWILGLLAVAGIVCLALCRKEDKCNVITPGGPCV
jgi:hypothetical protein